MQGRRLNRGLGSVCSTTELRPLVISDCTQESTFRTAVDCFCKQLGTVALGSQRDASQLANFFLVIRASQS